jgi:hypothetical protein
LSVLLSIFARRHAVQHVSGFFSVSVFNRFLKERAGRPCRIVAASLGSWVWTTFSSDRWHAVQAFSLSLGCRADAVSVSRILSPSIAGSPLEVFTCFPSVFARRRPASLEAHAATAPVFHAVGLCGASRSGRTDRVPSRSVLVCSAVVTCVFALPDAIDLTGFSPRHITA